jgi:hypothetical protein
MFCAPGLIFGGAECVGSRFHVLRARTHFQRHRGGQVLYSCFALRDSISGVPRASGPVFMFCAPGLIFSGTEGVGSRFHVLHSRTHFRRYRGRRISFSCFARLDSFRQYRGCRLPFSCFALPDSISAVPRGSGPIFMFCAPELIFGGTKGVGSRFHDSQARIRFQRYLGGRVPFSCFACPDSIWAVSSVSGPVFMFCAPGLVFHGVECVRSRFHVLRARTHFRQYRGGRVPFSCFARPDSIWAVPRATGPVFMFCAPGLIFSGAECVGSRFHVLRSRTQFRRYRGRRVPFSHFARPYSFSAVPRVSAPVSLFCAPGHIFGVIEGVGSRFHVMCARTRVRRYRGHQIPFLCFAHPNTYSAVPRASGSILTFCAPRLNFGGTEGVGSRSHVLHGHTRFRRYRGRQVPLSCFAPPDSFSAVPRASAPVFMICAP